MKLSKLKNIQKTVGADPTLIENNRFNFGKFKNLKFEQAMKKSNFYKWAKYMYSISDDWDERIERDMKNFDRFLVTYYDGNEEYDKLKTSEDRLKYIFKDVDDDDDEEITFWFGRYRKLSLDKVPKDYKVWWANETLKNHPIDNIEFWESDEGLKTFKLLEALNLC